MSAARFSRKPRVSRSPVRAPPRQGLRSTESISVQVPQGSVEKKTGLGSNPMEVNKSPMFERGRLYDLYIAKRNERLKRKLGIETEMDECLTKMCSKYDLGVTVEKMKRRDSKKMESGRKSVGVAVDSAVDRSRSRRYSVRSGKGWKKSFLSICFSKSSGDDAGEKKKHGRFCRVW